MPGGTRLGSVILYSKCKRDADPLLPLVI